MTEDEKMLDLYRGMVWERHKIWLARQYDVPQPWTNDPVLANRKFTNMFRVLDPGSQFVFELQDEDPANVIARLVFYRLTNKPSTWYAMRAALGHFPLATEFVHQQAILFQALDAYRKSGNRVFSGAYIIVPEPGTPNDKVGGALRVTGSFLVNNGRAFLAATTQEERFSILRSTPGLGKFLSMQILTDWLYLHPEDEEPDLSFVVAGPGAIRGAALINSSKKPENVIHDLTVDWRDDPLVRLNKRPLTPMDVQNTLCEFGKYVRETVNPRKKTPYRPAHPGAQPAPVLPQWW
jgi:hypothetical protein